MMRHMRRGSFAFDIVGRFKLWMIVMAAVMGVSLLSLAVRQLNLGLEFKGGTSFEVQAEEDATVGDVRAALERVEVTEAVVQRVGDRGFYVETPHLGVELQDAAAEQIARVVGVDPDQVSVEDVGPSWGRQITSKAIRALVIFVIVAILFISIRLEPKMAAASFVALVHDIVVSVGVYSLTGFVVTPATVVAFLTILGYSLYDTVVIFDRVKERSQHLSAAGKLTYSQMANESLNQVLVRSVNTSVTSLIPVGSLLFVGSYLLGAATLRELALALFVGLAAGTYSSIFVATPILAVWKEKEARWATLRARIAARSGETTAPRAVATDVEDREADRAAVSSPTAPRPAGGVRPPKGGRKRKRRR